MSSKNETNTLPCNYGAYMELLGWSSRMIKGDKRGFVDQKQPALLHQLSFRGKQWHVLCTILGKITHGATGTTSHIEHFHQNHGCNRRPRKDAVAQLFG